MGKMPLDQRAEVLCAADSGSFVCAIVLNTK